MTGNISIYLLNTPSQQADNSWKPRPLPGPRLRLLPPRTRPPTSPTLRSQQRSSRRPRQRRARPLDISHRPSAQRGRNVSRRRRPPNFAPKRRSGQHLRQSLHARVLGLGVPVPIARRPLQRTGHSAFGRDEYCAVSHAYQVESEKSDRYCDDAWTALDEVGSDGEG
jgi:hypothetical protein